VTDIALDLQYACYTRGIAIAIGPSSFKHDNSIYIFAYKLCEEA